MFYLFYAKILFDEHSLGLENDLPDGGPKSEREYKERRVFNFSLFD